MTLRILSYNIRRGGAGREGPLAAVISAVAPDIVESLRLDHGDRHVALEARVAGEEDPLTAALAEETPDRVASAGERAGHARRRGDGRRRGLG